MLVPAFLKIAINMNERNITLSIVWMFWIAAFTLGLLLGMYSSRSIGDQAYDEMIGILRSRVTSAFHSDTLYQFEFRDTVLFQFSRYGIEEIIKPSRKNFNNSKTVQYDTVYHKNQSFRDCYSGK